MQSVAKSVRNAVVAAIGLGAVAAVPSLTPDGAATPAATAELTMPPISQTNRCWFTDTFGAPRSGGRTHQGVDIVAARGVPVQAVVDGVIAKITPDAPGLISGNLLRLAQPDGTYFTYVHLDGFAAGLSVGQSVSAGTVLGFVGQTGNAGTPHLHFEIHPAGGAAINPTAIVRGEGTCTAAAGVVSPTPAPVPPPPPTVAPVAPAPTVPATIAAIPAVSVLVPTPEPAPIATPIAPEAALAATFNPAVEVYEMSWPRRAGRVAAAQIAGFPGVPRNAVEVELQVMVIGDAVGRAAIWSCGSRLGLDRGIPLGELVPHTPVWTTVRIAPGDRGRVCFTASTNFHVRIDVSGYR